MAMALEHGIDFVTRLLDQAGVVHQVVPHAPTFRAVDEAAAAHADAHYTAKTVVLHDRGGLRLAVIPADCRLDLDKARRLLGATQAPAPGDRGGDPRGVPAVRRAARCRRSGSRCPR